MTEENYMKLRCCGPQPCMTGGQTSVTDDNWYCSGSACAGWEWDCTEILHDFDCSAVKTQMDDRLPCDCGSKSSTEGSCGLIR